MSCRTGPLRVGRSLRDFVSWILGLGGPVSTGPPVGPDDLCLSVSVVAAEAVDEAAVAFVGALGGGGCGPGDGAEEFALFGGFAAGFFAFFGFAVEGLGDGGGAALLA